MRSLKYRPALMAASCLVALSLLGTSAGANADPKADRGKEVVRPSAAISEKEQARVRSYWTPQRMKSAIEVGNSKLTTNSSRATEASPQPRLGKVFFSIGSSNYVCSGTSTQSTNGDVVTTAGHCISSQGSYVTNWAFAPAYDRGSKPYGLWTASKLVASSAWLDGEDFTEDFGFAVVGEQGGKSLNDVVGSYPIGFNLGYNLPFDSYGYPADKKYKGEKLFKCSGTSTKDARGSGIHLLPCDMTGGSSGGGWITNGTLNSVNSHGYRNEHGSMYGPYFGDVAQQVYTTASTS